MLLWTALNAPANMSVAVTLVMCRGVQQLPYLAYTQQKLLLLLNHHYIFLHLSCLGPYLAVLLHTVCC